jgi:transposase
MKTGKGRKGYSPEFKKEALSRCEKEGVSKTAEELGVSQATLNRWKNEKERKPLGPDSSDKPTYEELEKENDRLRQEIGYIKDINDVLKKSTAIFSSQEMADFRQSPLSSKKSRRFL